MFPMPTLASLDPGSTGKYLRASLPSAPHSQPPWLPQDLSSAQLLPKPQPSPVWAQEAPSRSQNICWVGAPPPGPLPRAGKAHRAAYLSVQWSSACTSCRLDAWVRVAPQLGGFRARMGRHRAAARPWATPRFGSFSSSPSSCEASGKWLLLSGPQVPHL